MQPLFLGCLFGQIQLVTDIVPKPWIGIFAFLPGLFLKSLMTFLPCSPQFRIMIYSLCLFGHRIKSLYLRPFRHFFALLFRIPRLPANGHHFAFVLHQTPQIEVIIQLTSIRLKRG